MTDDHFQKDDRTALVNGSIDEFAKEQLIPDYKIKNE
jgi:hypothetical protein